MCIVNRSPWHLIDDQAGLCATAPTNAAASRLAAKLAAETGRKPLIKRASTGPYQVRLRLAGVPPQTRTFSTRTQAKAWLLEATAQARRGDLADLRPLAALMFGQAALRYAEAKVPEANRPESPVWYRCQRLADSWLGGHRLSAITPLVLRQWVKQRQSALPPVKPTTITRELALIQSVLTFGHEHVGVVPPAISPASGRLVPRPAPHDEAERERRLEPGEWSALMRAMRRQVYGSAAGRRGYRGNPAVIDFVRLALETGMRRGELLGLQWSHVQLDRGRSHVALPAALTKTKEARSIPLSVRARRVLAVRAARCGRQGRVFEGETIDSMGCAFDRARKRAGLHNLRLHDLRHEFVSRLFEQTDLREFEVMAISGHADPRMLKRYLHLRAASLAERVAVARHAFRAQRDRAAPTGWRD